MRVQDSDRCCHSLHPLCALLRRICTPPGFVHVVHMERLGTWNVRSLVDTEGSVKTARQGRDVCHAEDRRVDLVVRELKRYDVKVAALQETLWFGSAVHCVGRVLCWQLAGLYLQQGSL